MRLSDYTMADLIALRRRAHEKREKSLNDALRLADLAKQFEEMIRARCYEATAKLDEMCTRRRRRERMEAAKRGD